MDKTGLLQLFLKNPVVSTDSRNIPQGCIYFALKGEKFDGNQYALEALEKGAAYAVISDPSVASHASMVVVEDTLKALQELAKAYRNTFRIPFLAVCGSNGKTTTKELLQAVLSTTYKTEATKGNLNNHIGVPLTLLSIPQDTAFAIIEIGANHRWETLELCKIVQPNFGIITNHGKDHLEGFGSVEEVQKANNELLDYLAETGGMAFANIGIPELAKDTLKVHRHTYALNLPADVTAEPLYDHVFAGLEFPDGMQVQSRLAGDFNAVNLLAAWTIGRYFKVAPLLMKQALEDYIPGMNRSQLVTREGVTYLMDAYNANPSSMEAAIRSFMEHVQGKKGLILGDMLEMGSFAEEEHLSIIRLLATYRPEVLILVGPEFGKHAGLLPCHHFENYAEAARWFRQQDWTGFSFLLKGSRGIAVEKVIPDAEKTQG